MLGADIAQKTAGNIAHRADVAKAKLVQHAAKPVIAIVIHRPHGMNTQMAKAPLHYRARCFGGIAKTPVGLARPVSQLCLVATEMHVGVVAEEHARTAHHIARRFQHDSIHFGRSAHRANYSRTHGLTFMHRPTCDGPHAGIACQCEQRFGVGR